jgi:hypothetical protein
MSDVDNRQTPDAIETGQKVLSLLFPNLSLKLEGSENGGAYALVLTNNRSGDKTVATDPHSLMGALGTLLARVSGDLQERPLTNGPEAPVAPIETVSPTALAAAVRRVFPGLEARVEIRPTAVPRTGYFATIAGVLDVRGSGWGATELDAVIAAVSRLTWDRADRSYASEAAEFVIREAYGQILIGAKVCGISNALRSFKAALERFVARMSRGSNTVDVVKGGAL